MKRLVIYHAGCVDGFTAAWCFWKVYGDEGADYWPAQYGDAPPDLARYEHVDIAGRRVGVVIAPRYEHVDIVDFSYPRTELVRMHEEMRGELLVLDHHKTAEADLRGLGYCQFDMERSGAGIAWDYLHPGEPRPPLVNYVEDRDLWRFALPFSAYVNRYIGASDRTDFRAWDLLAGWVRDDLGGLAQLGEAMQLEVDAYVKCLAKEARVMTVEGYAVPVVNAPYVHVSELGHALAQDVPFAVAWFQQKDGRYKYSLRSAPGGVDVSEIAGRYPGGGGHRAAAGFTSDMPPDHLFSAYAPRRGVGS